MMVFNDTVWARAPAFIKAAIKEAITRRGQFIAMNLDSGCATGEHSDHERIGEALEWLNHRVVPRDTGKE